MESQRDSPDENPSPPTLCLRPYTQYFPCSAPLHPAVQRSGGLGDCPDGAGIPSLSVLLEKPGLLASGMPLGDFSLADDWSYGAKPISHRSP